MNAMTKEIPARLARSAETEQALSALGGTLLRIEDVIAWTRLSRTTIYRFIRQGTFPAGKATGANSRRWTRAEVMGWLQARE